MNSIYEEQDEEDFEEKIIIDESECLIENVKLINKLKVILRLALNFRFI